MLQGERKFLKIVSEHRKMEKEDRKLLDNGFTLVHT